MTIRLAKRSRKISSICAKVIPSGNLRGSQFFLVVFAMFIFQRGRLFPNYNCGVLYTMLRRLLPTSFLDTSVCTPDIHTKAIEIDVPAISRPGRYRQASCGENNSRRRLLAQAHCSILKRLRHDQTWLPLSSCRRCLPRYKWHPEHDPK